MKLRKSCSKSLFQKGAQKWILGSLLSIGMAFSMVPTARAQISEADTGEFRRIEQPLGLKVGVAIAGAGLVSLELWWFLLSKTKAQLAQTDGSIQSIDITVDGGYSPDRIVVQVGQLVHLNFLRKDSNSCLEQIILPDFNKAVDLPLNQTATVKVVPERAGDYTFHCGMNMFRGTLTAKDSDQY